MSRVRLLVLVLMTSSLVNLDSRQGAMDAAAGVLADLEQYDKSIPSDWGNLLQSESNPTVWSGRNLKYIGMPVGGICAGTVYIGGDGSLWNWDIFNVRTLNPGGPGDKFYLEPMEPVKRFEQGFVIRTDAGGQREMRPLNRDGFRGIQFLGQYPVATVEYADGDCPVHVSLKAFSPFIPTDADESGLPATVMQYTVTNTSSGDVEVELAGYLQNAVCLFNADNVQAGRVNRAAAEQDLSQLHCTAAQQHPDRAPVRPDVLFDDFEDGSMDGWSVEGTAFGDSPVHKSALPARQPLAKYQGEFFINSHNCRSGEDSAASDAHTGNMTSRSFTIERKHVAFLISGGDHRGRTELRLVVEGRIVGRASGDNSNTMRLQHFDVSEYQGKQAVIEIVDHEEGGWGHLCVDRIIFSDRIPDKEPMDGLPDYGSMALTLLDRTTDDWVSVSCDQEKDALPASVFTADRSSEAAHAGMEDKLIGAVGRRLALGPGQQQTVTFVLSWHFPNLHTGDNGLRGLRNMASLRAHYSKRFDSAGQVGRHIQKNSDRLIGSTLLWNTTWYDSTLPKWFLTRIFVPADSLATTVFQRFTDLTGDRYNEGRVYAWEGVYLGNGTCTHVLHYEQAMGRLFPNMTRQLRDQVDYGLSFRDDGVIRYRGEHSGAGHHYGSEHAVDGHCGTILRTYREHTMSPDNAFLDRNYPKIKKSVELLIAQDKENTGVADGILEGSQYNTLDRVWYGKIPWISSLYCAALRAGAAMAEDAGDAEFSVVCRDIADAGYRNIPAELFNGEYFVQKLDPDKLYAPNVNIGCHIDQMLGQAWAAQAGLPDVLPPGTSRTALQALFRYNFQADVGPYLETAPIQPVRFYALPGEAGTVICSFPKGGAEEALGQVRNDWEKLVVGYFSECMTGFEYQAAAQMIDEGLVAEGFAIVKAIDGRYHASKRNPYNEVEYGNHYSRAMSSYGCLIAASGFEYHGPRGVLGFSPRVSPENFKAPFTVAQGWGSFSQTRDGDVQTERIELKFGKLALKQLNFELPEGVHPSTASVTLNGRRVDAAYDRSTSRVRVVLDDAVQLKAGSVLRVEMK